MTRAIVLTVGLKVPADSAAGKITDTATATAVLGNCKGNASANAASLTGLAKLDAAALTGSDPFRVPGTTVATAAVVPGRVRADPHRRCPDRRRRHQPPQWPMRCRSDAVGSIALVGSLAAQRRRRNG